MTRYLTLAEVLEIQKQVIDRIGGSHGIRDINAVDSAVAQPEHSMWGEDLYPSLSEKAAALGFSLIMNHGFVDGNKRVGYEAMKLFLEENGFTLSGDTDEKERAVLAVASSEMGRDGLVAWLAAHIIPFTG